MVYCWYFFQVMKNPIKKASLATVAVKRWWCPRQSLILLLPYLCSIHSEFPECPGPLRVPVLGTKWLRELVVKVRRLDCKFSGPHKGLVWLQMPRHQLGSSQPSKLWPSWQAWFSMCSCLKSMRWRAKEKTPDNLL